jgi:hypothetical protein
MGLSHKSEAAPEFSSLALGLLITLAGAKHSGGRHAQATTPVNTAIPPEVSIEKRLFDRVLRGERLRARHPPLRLMGQSHQSKTLSRPVAPQEIT